MRIGLSLLMILMLGCSQPSGSQTGASSQADTTYEWPNEPVQFYAAQPPVIDFSKYQPAGVNVTADYERYFGRMGDGLPTDLAELRNYKVIFVQGIMGNYVDFMGKLIMNKFDQYEYFYEHMDWLKSVGVEYERLKTDTEDTIEANAILVERAVRASSKPVVLVAHSKGGLETLIALNDSPSLYPKVKGVLFMQSPFYGTPVADYLSDNPVWDFLANFVLAILGGSNKAMHNLTSYERVPWMQKWDFLVQHVVKELRVLCFSTWKDDEPNRRDSMFEFSRNKVKVDGGIDNDGLVPWNSMILPNSRYVRFEGHDHGSTVTANKYIQLDRPRFFRSLLQTLFAK
ncbi:MAG TPA: hypothetical protein VFV50_06590 [Bdellovibrionales bacterium]|nr:hypothetical protein [Bdellovibrionales bacterium]